MVTIKVNQTANTKESAADYLRHIAKLIDQGYTSGHQPTWTLEGEDEPEEDED